MSKMKRSEPEFREGHLSTPASRLSLVSFPSPGTAYLPSVSNESKIPHTSQLPGLSGLLHTQAKRTWMKPHCLCCVTLNLNRTNGKVTLERTNPLILPCDWWPAIYWPRDLADCFFFLQAEPAQCIIKEKTAFFSFSFFFLFFPPARLIAWIIYFEYSGSLNLIEGAGGHIPSEKEKEFCQNFLINQQNLWQSYDEQLWWYNTKIVSIQHAPVLPFVSNPVCRIPI